MTRQFIIRNRKSGLFDFVRARSFFFARARARSAPHLFILFYFDMKVRDDRTRVYNSRAALFGASPRMKIGIAKKGLCIRLYLFAQRTSYITSTNTRIRKLNELLNGIVGASVMR